MTDFLNKFGALNSVLPPTKYLTFGPWIYLVPQYKPENVLILGYAGGTVGVSLYDGTNRANYVTTASTTINTNAYTTNNTFTNNETIRVDIGTPVSSPTNISCRFRYVYDSD